MAKAPDLNDVICWLEQAGAIIDYIAEDLDGNEHLGSATSLSLYGASSLLDRARETVSAENQRLCTTRAGVNEMEARS